MKDHSSPEQLVAPKPVRVIQKEKAEGMVKMDPSILAKLDGKVAEFIDEVVQTDIHSAPFQEKVTAIHNMGNQEIRASAGVSNRLLDRPVRAMEAGLFDNKSPVAKTLIDLRTTIESLDPARQGDLLSPRKILGLIPFSNRLRTYFLKYQSSQRHINIILNSLNHGQDELRKDNNAIEEEKRTLWQLIEQLQQYVYFGKQLDNCLEKRIEEINAVDQEKARIIKEEMLFYVRQKIQDLLTQLAVNIQGYLALDIIRKSNLELIKGVERATTTTLSALRTALMVAQALANQKLVLDQITALNTTTGNCIESTSQLLKQQSTQIHQQAAGSTIELEKLQTAFNNIYETMDMISSFKNEALGTLLQTVANLSTEVEKAQGYLDKVRDQKAAGAMTRTDTARNLKNGTVNF